MQELRNILVVEDNEINRELLADILAAASYNVLTAENGEEGLKLLMEYGNKISLILLDIVMPVMDGYGFLNAVKKDGQYTGIPIIVTTANNAKGDEIKALEMGASDFVTKPYDPQIVIKRVEGLIRLRETSLMLHKVEYDADTGILSREFFYEYARKRLAGDERVSYDMLCFEVESYDVISYRYGIDICTELMKHIVGVLLSAVKEEILIGRIDDKQIAILMHHVPYERQKEFFEDCLADIGFKLIPDVKVNCGVYPEVDRSLSTEIMCNYAKMPISRVTSNFNKHIEKFDDAMRDSIFRRNFLLENKKTALKEKQFKVYYQPKHNVVRNTTSGAEALVRWINPEAGFISPGEFITLFEQNGFIFELDKYMLDQVCADIRRWLDEGRRVVPVSVNVSQMDFDSANLDDILEQIVDSHNVPHEYIHFEITESARATDNAKKKEMVNKFRDKGFEIELDDFGSGYSSLTTLGEFSTDVIKVDMGFIRNMFDPKYNAILDGIIYTASCLNVKVVTEGVETSAQVETLRQMCGENIDLNIQGYYYSKPLPVEEFEKYLENN